MPKDADGNEIEIEGSVNDNGLTTEEQAQFDQMRNADDGTPSGGEPGEAQPDVEVKPAAVEGEEEGEEGDDDAASAGADQGAAVAAGAGKDGQPQGEKPPRRVTWSRHTRELAERDAKIKALTEQAESGKITQAKFEERLAIINEALTAKAAPKEDAAEDDPEPDVEANIFEHNAWLKRQNMKLAERLDRMEQNGQVQQAENLVRQTYSNDVESYVQQEPAFPQAYQFLMANRIAELAVHYFGKDLYAEGATLTAPERAQINRTIIAEEKEVVSAAIQKGQSPAQRIYALARARGFKPAPPAAAADAGKGKEAAGAKKATGGAPGSLAEQAEAVANGNGAAAGGNGKVSVREEIERAKAGVEGSRSLSEGGGAPKITLTPERLASMPQEEFDILVSRLTEDELRVAMGGARAN